MENDECVFRCWSFTFLSEHDTKVSKIKARVLYNEQPIKTLIYQNLIFDGFTCLIK